MTAIAESRGPDGSAPRLPRINPVSKLFMSLVVSITLMMSIDTVSAGVALALIILLLPWSGIGWRQFWLRTAPVFLAAPFAAVTTVLYGEDRGEVYWQWGAAVVSDGSVMLAVAICLRVLAIGLPGVVMMATTDPTDLADGLAQIVRLPAHFVLGALAGMRMVGLFLSDWRSLADARRSRGVADSGRIRRFVSQAFALLALAIRRGGKLATAMEAKGFPAAGRRTWARSSRLGRADGVLVALGITIVGVSVTASVVTGNWSFVLA